MWTTAGDQLFRLLICASFGGYLDGNIKPGASFLDVVGELLKRMNMWISSESTWCRTLVWSISVVSSKRQVMLLMTGHRTSQWWESWGASGSTLSQGIPVVRELGSSGQPGHRASQWAAWKPHLQKLQCHIRQSSGDMGFLRISEWNKEGFIVSIQKVTKSYSSLYLAQSSRFLAPLVEVRWVHNWHLPNALSWGKELRILDLGGGVEWKGLTFSEAAQCFSNMSFYKNPLKNSIQILILGLHTPEITCQNLWGQVWAFCL